MGSTEIGRWRRMLLITMSVPSGSILRTAIPARGRVGFSLGTADSQQHTYTKNGTYTVVLAASFGIYTGTNTMQIRVGAPLAATITANPYSGSAPLTVNFIGQATGGRTNTTAFDTTDDHLGA